MPSNPPFLPSRMVILFERSFKNACHAAGKKKSNSQRSVRPWIAGLEPFQRVEELFLWPSRWLQEPPKAFQSSSKYLLDVTTVCFGSLLFPKLIFQLCITQNLHFCVFGDWFRLVLWSPNGLPRPSKSASRRFQTLQSAFKRPQDVTSECILQ